MKNDHYFKELTKLTKGIYGNPVRVQWESLPKLQ